MKLKVSVTDDDHNRNDDVDGLVQLLNPTPSRSSSAADWTSITVRGQRSSRPTRSINLCFLSNVSGMNTSQNVLPSQADRFVLNVSVKHLHYFAISIVELRKIRCIVTSVVICIRTIRLPLSEITPFSPFNQNHIKTFFLARPFVR